MHVKEKFPCGYEVEFRTSILDLFATEAKVETGECPIHGKNCKKGL